MLRSKLLELKIKQRQEEAQAMKGDVKKIEWGAQIRSYVFCPYTLAQNVGKKIQSYKINIILRF